MSRPQLEVADIVRQHGEPMPWRGPDGVHLRFPLAEGLEVRVDREEGRDYWSVWPFYRVDHRLRLAVLETRRVPDSPYDAFLIGVAVSATAVIRAEGGADAAGSVGAMTVSPAPVTSYTSVASVGRWCSSPWRR